SVYSSCYRLSLSTFYLLTYYALLYVHISTIFSLFFFNDTATTEIYTLSLHDALPISDARRRRPSCRTRLRRGAGVQRSGRDRKRDRKSTRLNSSHEWISYAVFCLKKKKNNNILITQL